MLRTQPCENPTYHAPTRDKCQFGDIRAHTLRKGRSRPNKCTLKITFLSFAEKQQSETAYELYYALVLPAFW